MNFRTTFILLALLVLVGAVLLFTRDRGDKSGTETADASAKKLVGLDSKDVTKIAITPADGQKIVLERVTGSGATGAPAGAMGEWRLVEPIKAPAQALEVDNLLRDLTDLRSRNQVEPEKKAAIGLDKPAYTVELTGNGKTVQVAVGNKSVVGDTLYVQVSGRDKPDVVAAGRIVENLDRPASDYRSKKLVDATAAQIRQLQIEQPGQPPLRLEKSGEDWRVVEPVQVPADSSAVSDMTFALAGLNAEEYANPQPGSITSTPAFYGLNNPQLTVSFTTVAPQTQPSTQPSAQPSAAPATGPASRPAAMPAMTTVKFGRAEDITQKNVYVTVLPAGGASASAPVAKVPMTSLNSFKKTPLELRDKKVVEIKPDDVSEITLVIDRPSGGPGTAGASATQPSTRPAEPRTLRITRRKVNLTLGPVLEPTPAPTTGPATGPTTGPATHPATQAATTQPSSKWVIASEDGVAADDGQVTDLLGALNPLRAAKYLDKMPATQPSPNYVVRVSTVGAGGASTGSYEVRVTDMGATNLPVAQFRDLTFEVDRSFLRKLEGDFKTKRAEPPMPSFPGGGMPGGGFPGGLPGGD